MIEGSGNTVKLTDGSRVAVVGGGPAGAMAGFFLLELAERIDLKIQVDIYESRDYRKTGPAGCNMCAGVVSENLVQTLAAEGINLPPIVVQRGIDSYVLHTSDLPPVTIETPANDLRIATVYRGAGPPPAPNVLWTSFDGYLLELARRRGANVIKQRVGQLGWRDGLPLVTCKGREPQTYDLLIGAVGVNSPTLRLFEELGFAYRMPKVHKSYLAEVKLGAAAIQEHLGNSMHIFLLDIPKLKFAAITPKVEYTTVCLHGELDKETIRAFMESPEVRRCFPPDWQWLEETVTDCVHSCEVCRCMPKLNVGLATNPFGDRVVLVGDAAVSRLYKDGIGSAYITAKAAAVTAVFLGVAAEDFKQHYWPVCHRLDVDNQLGLVIFYITSFYQKFNFMRRGMVRMVSHEQVTGVTRQGMSRVLWDTFTGSATYREIFLRSIRPDFLFRLLMDTVVGFFRKPRQLPGGWKPPEGR